MLLSRSRQLETTCYCQALDTRTLSSPDTEQVLQVKLPAVFLQIPLLSAVFTQLCVHRALPCAGK